MNIKERIRRTLIHSRFEIFLISLDNTYISSIRNGILLLDIIVVVTVTYKET